MAKIIAYFIICLASFHASSNQYILDEEYSILIPSQWEIANVTHDDHLNAILVGFSKPKEGMLISLQYLENQANPVSTIECGDVINLNEKLACIKEYFVGRVNLTDNNSSWEIFGEGKAVIVTKRGPLDVYQQYIWISNPPYYLQIVGINRQSSLESPVIKVVRKGSDDRSASHLFSLLRIHHEGYRALPDYFNVEKVYVNGRLGRNDIPNSTR